LKQQNEPNTHEGQFAPVLSIYYKPVADPEVYHGSESWENASCVKISMGTQTGAKIWWPNVKPINRRYPIKRI